MIADDLVAAFADVPTTWRDALNWDTAVCEQLLRRVRAASGQRAIAPTDPFRALRLVAPQQARVVVFGQDPYPTPGQADGLAFSAERSTRPSLRRIFEVLQADRPGWQRPQSGRLDAWAHQGVLLLNPALTVEVGRKESHLDVGWQALTCKIIKVLLDRDESPVFLLWGAKAAAFYDASVSATGLSVEQARRAQVLRTRHPSNDFGRDFMREGSHFVATADRINWWAL